MSVTYQPKTTIASRYEIQEILGRGGVGITYAAKVLASGEQVALKIVSLAGLEDWKSVELLQREAQVLAQLDHPGIPSYIDYFTIDRDRDRQFCIVQKLAPGKSLATLVQEGWRTNEKEIKQIAERVLDILIYLHQRQPPIIHRDIKPENLIRSEDGEIYLVDFGAVREKYQTELTQGSTIVGTFGYMAPEQFKGRTVAASDLYSLGATLLYLLTHRSPTELPHDNLRIKFRSRVQVSPALAQWLEKLIAPDRETRFASAEEALTALKQSQWVKTQNWLKVGMGIAGLVAVGFLGFNYRWLLLSRLGVYPVGCNTGAIEAYLEQGGRPEKLVASRDSALWCDAGLYVVSDLEKSLIYAISSGNVDYVERLLTVGAEVNVQDKDGNTPLLEAARSKYINEEHEIVKYLLSAGAEVNVQDKDGNTPLLLAARSMYTNEEVVKHLLSAGADVNVQDDSGETPLHYLAPGTSLEVVKRLLSAGAEVNVQDKDGNTPLHKAAAANRAREEVVKRLLSAGANPKIQNKDGETALDLTNDQEIRELLKRHSDQP